MLTRMSGTLVALEEHAGQVAPGGGGGSGERSGGRSGGEPGLVYEVLLPGYVSAALSGKVGQAITLETLHYLEGQGQGTSFVPRLIGFLSRGERAFFELLTTVKGVGNRKALRMLSVPPGEIAGLIVAKDAKGLRRLPEVGARLAETMIAELTGKVERVLSRAEVAGLERASGGGGMGVVGEIKPRGAWGSEAEEAIEALVSLGETRGDAERKVERALSRLKEGEGRTASAIVGAVFSAGGGGER